MRMNVLHHLHHKIEFICEINTKWNQSGNKECQKINTLSTSVLKRGLLICTIASEINVTPKGVRLSEKLQLTAALCDEI